MANPAQPAKHCKVKHCDTRRNTAKHYQTLPNTTKHCQTLQHITTHVITLHHTASDNPVLILQSPAKHCNTLQHVASHWCNLFDPIHRRLHITTDCRALPNTATHCTTPQHIASNCIALHHTATRYNTHCTALHHTATCYNTHCIALHRTATRYNTLQHTSLVSTIIYRCDTTHMIQFISYHLTGVWYNSYHIIWLESHLWRSHGCHTCDSYMSQAISTANGSDLSLFPSEHGNSYAHILICATWLATYPNSFWLLQMIGLFCRISSLL